MSGWQHRRTGLLAKRCAALTLASFLGVAAVHAQPSEPRADEDAKKQCLNDHVEAQRDQRAGKLLRARARLLECMRAECGEVLRSDCVRLLSEVQSSLATVRLGGVSASGEPVEIDRAWIDEVELLLDTDRATTVDPGRHELRARSKGGEQASNTVELVPGVRDVPVLFRFVAASELAPVAATAGATDRPGASSGARAPMAPVAGARVAAVPLGPKAAPPAHSASRAGPADPSAADPGAVARGWAYGIGALGLTALGGFAVLGGLGLSAQGEMEESCAPHCSIDQVREMDRLYAGADICLATGLTALVSAAVIFFIAPNPTEDAPSAIGPAQVGVWRF